jgi:uncharacterized protein (DUF488 family)
VSCPIVPPVGAGNVVAHTVDGVTELFTIGHGTHPVEEMTALLRGAGVLVVIDIRIAPGSRRHPQFQRESLADWLPETGIEYRWERRLGGFRHLQPDSPDTALRNDSFRAYAGYMRTPEFRDALDELLDEAGERPSAVMCSESVWWRCHRRLVADHVALVDGGRVRHIMPDGRLAEHRPTDGVRVAGDELYYDVLSASRSGG